MYGLEAITANNGWAMVVTGPLIVMSGLAILALIISQLHKLVAIFDKKAAPDPAADSDTGKGGDEISVPRILPSDIFETADIYQPLIDRLDQPFELKDLYRAAVAHNFPHPILTVGRFRDAGILIPEGEGLFFWNR